MLSGVTAVVRQLHTRGFDVAIVTNQAAVARGIITDDEVVATHRQLIRYFNEQDAPLLAVEYCPHHPEALVEKYRLRCGCRKPAPGMLQQLATRFQIDLSASWMVGDNLTDLAAGMAAGCRVSLVKTGHGSRFAKHVAPGIPVLESLEELLSLVGGDQDPGLRK